MASPLQDIRIWEIQDRTNRSNATRPWVLRWRVDGTERSRAFATKPEADDLRSRLVIATRSGERFDRASGLPLEWLPQPSDRQLHQWVREWLAEQWPEWQPRTRRSAVEAMSRFVPSARSRTAPSPPPSLRRYLVDALIPHASIDPAHQLERWLSQWSPPLGDLSAELLAAAERELALGVSGQRLSAAVVARYRKNAHAVIVRAVDLGILDHDPWPPPPRGRNNRKATRRRRSIDVRRLPDPTTMAAIISGLRSHQPASRTYQVMTAVAYYAGLRPSEVVMLRARSLALPATGWGAIDVVEADIDWDEPGEPKTGQRLVPIPPVLVSVLAGWVDESGIRGSELLFRTRNGNRPTPSNWSRALKRGCAAAGHAPMRIYDCRHAAATAWLRAGVPLGVVAMRLGHAVETLVSTYVGALEGDDAIANIRIEAVLEPSGADRTTYFRTDGNENVR